MTCPCCDVPTSAHVPLSADVRAAPPPRPTPPLDVTRDILLSVEAQVERLRGLAESTGTGPLANVLEAILRRHQRNRPPDESLIVTLAALAVLWACRLRGAR